MFICCILTTIVLPINENTIVKCPITQAIYDRLTVTGQRTPGRCVTSRELDGNDQGNESMKLGQKGEIKQERTKRRKEG